MDPGRPSLLCPSEGRPQKKFLSAWTDGTAYNAQPFSCPLTLILLNAAFVVAIGNWKLEKAFIA